MKKMILVCTTSLLLLSACASDNPVENKREYHNDDFISDMDYAPENEDSARYSVYNEMFSVLSEPDTAKYRFYPVVRASYPYGETEKKGWFLCGLVNAKNSYGVYTGYREFFAELKSNNTGAGGVMETKANVLFGDAAKQHCELVKKTAFSYIQKNNINVLPEKNLEKNKITIETEILDSTPASGIPENNKMNAPVNMNNISTEITPKEPEVTK